MALAENQITLEIVSDGQEGPRGATGATGATGAPGALDETQVIQLENLYSDVNGGIGYVVSDITGEFGEDEVYVDVDTFSSQGDSQVFTYTTAWSPNLATWGVILSNDIPFANGDTFTVTLTDKEGITTTLETQSDDIVTIGTILDQQGEQLDDVQEDIDQVATALLNELVASGYAKITALPSVELGKTDSAWKMLITNAAIQLKKNTEIVASLAQDIENVNQTTLRADNARLATVKLRSSNADSKCVLGIVAQSNGHISLKEV